MIILKQGAQTIIKRTMEQMEIPKGTQSKWKILEQGGKLKKANMEEQKVKREKGEQGVSGKFLKCERSKE